MKVSKSSVLKDDVRCLCSMVSDVKKMEYQPIGEVSSREKLAERIEGDSSDGRSDPHVLLGASFRSSNRFTRWGSYVLTDDGSIPSKSEQVVKVTVWGLSAVDCLPSFLKIFRKGYAVIEGSLRHS
ncbi:hypothetical protein NPIL_578391 [Nephila pilipes]|uniref:Uncharacterized protein n=1 Tax=Nephila pilipes TaxID=299642 RepID=A0A8X6TWD3_NEPPI|nr:hypothetical protein NPIL_578391 [Nephila pilipes]